MHIMLIVDLVCKKYIDLFENIITGIHFNNKKDNQKLKHGGKQLKITKDVKLVKTNISVWPSTNHLLSKILLHLQNHDQKINTG